ncbi:hypothetical protein EDD18DRAFT_1114983 [Armillaria luteobubalina]|uniref:Uncharacterized protein n=1 Tax=Armillaria luteobubalina TaxID=153913 RepID=A0AA39P453_9AGAR|nr:hypothetical protein EDD18DRAFT_1114983 [Armillaria luteobubalina]
MNVGVGHFRLLANVSTVELCAKPFVHLSKHADRIMHFYMILVSSTGLAGARWRRLQLDVTSDYQPDGTIPQVTVTERDRIPSGTHMGRLLSFAILDEDVSVGCLLEILTEAGLDSVTVNAHDAACGRFCFRSLKMFADVGLIRGDWAPDAYEWHEEIGVASAELGVMMKEEDLINL